MEPGVEQNVALGRPQQRRPDRREALRLACAGHERRSTDLDAASAKDQKLDHEWPACAMACPSPRAMSHRFTGSAATRASASEIARLAQKRMSASPASIAPGTASTTARSGGHKSGL